MHMWAEGYGWHFWWMPPLTMLFIFVVIALVFRSVFRRHPMDGHGYCGGSHWSAMDRNWNPPTHSAMQILNERFARGEIQKDEYEDKKSTILSGGPRQS